MCSNDASFKSRRFSASLSPWRMALFLWILPGFASGAMPESDDVTSASFVREWSFYGQGEASAVSFVRSAADSRPAEIPVSTDGIEETGPRPSPPVWITETMLERARERYESGEEPWARVFAELEEKARLARNLVSEPYTGQSAHQLRYAALRDAEAAIAAAFMAKMSGEPAGLDTAKQILLSWARATPMPGSAFPWDPYKPGVPSEFSEAAAGLNMGICGLYFSVVYGLVDDHMSPDECAEIHAWFRVLAGIVERSREAWIENDYYSRQYFNNHLSAHIQGHLALAIALNDEAMIDYNVSSAENPRDAIEMIDGAVLMPSRGPEQFFHNDPSQATRPGEIFDRYRIMTENKGLAYAFVQLTHLTTAAELLAGIGREDLWEHVGPHGQCLRVAYEEYVGYLTTPDRETWPPYHAEDRFPNGAISLYEIAASRHPDGQAFQQVLRTRSDLRFFRDDVLLGDLPILLYDAPWWPETSVAKTIRNQEK